MDIIKRKKVLLQMLAFSYAPLYDNKNNFIKENLFKNMVNIASYIPHVGTIVGIAYIAFATFSYAVAKNNEAKLIAQGYFARGIIGLGSAFGSGIVLFALDILNTSRKSCIQSKTCENTLSITKHAEQILPSYQHALNKVGKPQEEIDKIILLIREYKSMSGLYTGEVKKVFEEADFFIVHGAIHVSHVALLVPVMVNFYRSFHDERALKLTAEEILALQVAAFFHDFGRTLQKNDLANDSHIMETEGAKACRKYLIEHGFDKNLAERMSHAIKYKDKNESGNFYIDEEFKNKDICAEILQNADCIAYLRAHDASFNPKHLDVMKRLSLTNQPDKYELLYQILDTTKLFLTSINDSPDENYKPFSKKYQSKDPLLFRGRINVDEKRKLETNPNCFAEMLHRMSQFEELALC